MTWQDGTLTPAESKTQTYHGRSGAGRGRAAQSRPGRNVDSSSCPGYICFSCILGDRRQLCWTSLRNHEQFYSYLKSREKQNPLLKTGSSAIYPRFISETASPLRFWLLVSVPMYIFSLKYFHTRHVRELIFVLTLIIINIMIDLVINIVINLDIKSTLALI